MKSALALLLSVMLAACSTTASDLAYAPAIPPAARLAPAISIVTVTDDREDKDPTYVGAVRNGFGIPMKTLTTARPIGQEVEAGVRSALQARNAFGSTGPLTLSLRLTKLSANQLVRREANVAFALTLTDRNGRRRYADSVDVQRVNGNLITFDAGILASVQDLLSLMDQTLTAAIDDALDKPGFVAAMNPG